MSMPTMTRRYKVEPAPPPDWDALPDLIPADEAARLLGVLPGSLRKYVFRGQIARPAASRGRRALYRRDDIRAYAEARRPEQASLKEVTARVEALESRIAALEAELAVRPRPGGL